MPNKRSPTGRLSQSEPNMQSIPVRTPEGKAIKDAFQQLFDYDIYVFSAVLDMWLEL